jgi:hypothetical protein
MYCPECGNDSGDAKFCPECGADLGAIRDALRGKTTGKATGQQGGKTTGQQGRRTGAERPPKGDVAPTAAQPARGLSPGIIWGGFGAIAVIVIVVVVMASGGFNGKKSDGSTSSPGAVQAIAADTSGDYRTLVTRANTLYDQGDAQFKKQNFEQGSAYFVAAAKIYAAALAKRSGDPAVGTDYANALFYSGELDRTIKQADSVLSRNPQYQAAYLVKGNALAHKARIADQQGDKAAAKAFYAAAKQVYVKTVSLGAGTDAGKLADEMLAALPK